LITKRLSKLRKWLGKKTSWKIPGLVLQHASVSVGQILAQPSSDSQRLSPYGCGKDEKLFLDEADQIYNNIVNVFANHHRINEISSNYIKSQSQVNFTYNDITLQICLDSKITFKQNNKDGLDAISFHNQG
jgi:hypothetical protein